MSFVSFGTHIFGDNTLLSPKICVQNEKKDINNNVFNITTNRN